VTTTYESLAEYAQSAGTVYFFLFFIGTLVYAFWPKNRARFGDAARMPLREDRAVGASRPSIASSRDERPRAGGGAADLESEALLPMSSASIRERPAASVELTGRHVVAILGPFFLAMFAANITLIYFALHTPHGSEPENFYDASQAFNEQIAEARAQTERGWKVDVTTRAEGEGERIMVEFRNRDGGSIPDLEVTARFEHPFDPALDREAILASDGLYYEGVATPVRPGRWLLVIEARRGLERVFRSENRIVVADTEANLEQ
jgi:nitrogen fixation protein FixH/cbb3-type cytochrome oxidase subunit 3